MSSSNQATELSMDDILASIRRIIAEEPAGKGNKPGPKLGPLPEPAEARKEFPPEIAQRGARSSFNQLTQRLNEVLDTPKEPPFEREAGSDRDTSLGLGKPEDLDQPYTAARKPPPLPEPVNPQAGEEAAPTRVISSKSNEMLRRQVYTQTDGNINNRIGRLDPKPLTTALARTVGAAPAVAFEAYRRKSETETPKPVSGRAVPPAPAAGPKGPVSPPVAEAKPVPPLPPALPPEARTPAASPVPPSVPPAPPVQSAVAAETPEDADALAGRLAASMRDLDATLGTKTADRKPVESPLAGEADKGVKARSGATLPAPKPWPESRETAKPVEAAKPIPPLPETKVEAKQPATGAALKPPAAEKLPPSAPLVPPSEPLSAAKKAPMPAASALATEKPVTAAEAAAILIKSAAPLAPAVATPAPAIEPSASAKPAAPLSPAVEMAPKHSIVEPVAPAARIAAAVAAPSIPSAPAGIRTLEDTVSDLLRPVLRQWLDEHMPRIFEKVLREELAGRVTPPKA